MPDFVRATILTEILNAMRIVVFIFCIVTTAAFAQPIKKFKTKYGIEDLEKVTKKPDYSNLKYWVAHPDKEDYADLVPGRNQLREYQEAADVDVFFIYPTIYAGKQDPEHPWFADVDDEKLNKRIGKSTIRNQATVFNSAAKVYSPLYRQAHLGVFQSDLGLKVDALLYAYRDVYQAFKYYLEHINRGRPIIIASHSQGTLHAVSLLRDFFEDKPLKDQLVAAYLVGMPLSRGSFNTIPICENPEETGCWVSWNTMKHGYYPPDHDLWYYDALSTNPLSWTSDSTAVSYGMNKGGVLRNYRKIKQGLTDAQNHRGMLWINKPKFFGNFLINWDRYHIADYNLFYLNIRENVEQRVDAFLGEASLRIADP